MGRYQSIREWFVSENGKENEAGKLFDATNEIIRRITRYAAQLSEKNVLGVNRREEYRKIASVFLNCSDIAQAHKLSAMVFGMERAYHLRGDLGRETESMNTGVYDEAPIEYLLKPRVRNYREKSGRTAIEDRGELKRRAREEMLKELTEQREKIAKLEENGRVDFGVLPVLEAGVRETLLKWISNAMEDASYLGRTEDGREFKLDMEKVNECCVVRCEDGIFTMPHISIVFL